MENELMNVVKVWLTIITCLCYCYVLGSAIPKGIKRLVFIVPVICLFLYLPLHVSIINFCGFTSFFIGWLANFKLLLFAFGKGPLCSHPPLSLPRFLAVASLPIKIQEETLNPKPIIKPLEYAIKVIFAAILIQSDKYNLYIHPHILPILTFIKMYIFLELGVAMFNWLACFLTGLNLEPTFDKPLLATSLQDFWGKRWNRVIPNILKPAVHEPIRDLAVHVVGRKWASIPGILVTYVVSGLMHELLFFYIGLEKPNGGAMLFFVIQGFGVAAGVLKKKTCGEKWKLPPVISWCLTMGFIMVTGFRWFIPALQRCNAFERGFSEYYDFANFIGNATRNFKSGI